MPLTRSFKETVRERAACEPAFRAALFNEAVQAPLAGDLETTTAALHAYIDATIGYEALAEATGNPPKSLMRMFGPKGIPQAKHLLAIVAILQERTGVRVQVKTSGKAA
jgi:hypothetical protein